MAGYLPPGSPFFPPTPLQSKRSRQLYTPAGLLLSPTHTGNNTSSPGAMIGIAIGFVAFFVLLMLLCRYRVSRVNAAERAAAAAAALAVRPQAPPQPDYWANDERRHRSDRHDDGGRTDCASPMAVLPSAFTYNQGVRHNVTGSGDEAASCSVCLGAFQVGETVRLLPVCLHLYHVECIDPWLEAHSTCPICRSGTDDDPMMHGGLLPA